MLFRKKSLLYIIVLCVVITGAIWLVKRNVEKEVNIEENMPITRALAARMLVLLDSKRPEGTAGEEWYIKYIKQVQDKMGWTDLLYQKQETLAGFAGDGLNFGELSQYLTSNGYEINYIKDKSGLKEILKQESEKKVSYAEFMNIYDVLVAMQGEEGNVKRTQLTIVGTPSNMKNEDIEKCGQWSCVTDKGNYNFEGIALDRYADNEIYAYVNDESLIAVIAVVSTDAVYRNTWILSGGEGYVEIFVCGIIRRLTSRLLDDRFAGKIGDVYLSRGKIVGLTIKDDYISGKVLKVTDAEIEIDGYGTLTLDTGFKVYKNCSVLEEVQLGDILVGYNLNRFAVADGKVCAAVVERELKAENIRVLLMTTDYESIFHERVTITSDDNFYVEKDNSSSGEKQKTWFNAGDLVDIYPGSEWLEGGRLMCGTDNLDGKIKILSIERSYGNPCYEGTLEISQNEKGLTIVNELLLEHYLCHVVPSEMPASFGVEALKVQAVCARSYAYCHLISNSYRQYGAHVDDSVSFQVYNNVEEQPDATQAVKETYGVVICRDGKVVPAYYYSTSCGHGSDLSLWDGTSGEGEIYQSRTVNDSEEVVDLSEEEAFRQYIMNENVQDYDYEFPYYRWDFFMPEIVLAQELGDRLMHCHEIDKDCVLTYDGLKYDECDIIPGLGSKISLKVLERSSGGAAKSLEISGENAKVMVKGELNIRYVLQPGELMLHTNIDTMINFYILPSAYVYIEKCSELSEGVEKEGFHLYGGGYGHGIGMSQNAVSTMVKKGMKFDDILKFFYNGISLVNVLQ